VEKEQRSLSQGIKKHGIGVNMETINFKDVVFVKAGVIQEIVDPHHKAYVRVQRGKLQAIPQKGAIIKERGDVHLKEAKEVLGKDYDKFTKDLNAYFKMDREIREIKNKLETQMKEKEEFMSSIRPLLSKFENLSEEENKFKTEFMAEGFKHKFNSFPRETMPYKELFEESFKRLTAKMQAEVDAMKGTLRKITAQEKFTREERVEKSDSLSGMADHFKNILRIKEEMLRLMKKVDTNVNWQGARKSVEDEFPKVVMLEKARKGVKDVDLKRSETEKLYLTTLDEEFEKGRVKGHVRTKKGKMQRVKEHSRAGKPKTLLEFFEGTSSLKKRENILQLVKEATKQGLLKPGLSMSPSKWKEYLAKREIEMGN
jgi:hypothetical protein